MLIYFLFTCTACALCRSADAYIIPFYKVFKTFHGETSIKPIIFRCLISKLFISSNHSTNYCIFKKELMKQISLLVFIFWALLVIIFWTYVFVTKYHRWVQLKKHLYFLSSFLFVRIPFGFQPIYIRIHYKKLFICFSDSESCSSKSFQKRYSFN